MTRSIPQTLRNELEASGSGEPLLLFLTVTHPTDGDSFHMVSDEYGDKLDDHILGGQRFDGVPFSGAILTDDDRPTRCQLGMLNVNRLVGAYVLALPSPCKIKCQAVAGSDFSETKDTTLDAHTEIGTATVVYTADYLYLRNVKGDPIWVEGDLAPPDLTGEPVPALRSTPDYLPGLTY